MLVQSVSVILISIIIGVLTVVFAKKLFRSNLDVETENKESPAEPQKPSHGLLHALLQDTEIFNTPIDTTTDLEIISGDVIYYLVEGSVEVLLHSSVILEKTEDYFVYSVYWLFNAHEKTEVTYRIRKNSLIYKIDRSNSTVRYLLINRLFKSSIYTIVNYLQGDLSLDIREIKTNIKSDTNEVLGRIKTEMELIKGVEKIEEITIDETYEIPPNTLLYVIEGEGVVDYSGNRSVGIKEHDLVGCLERIVSLDSNRIVKKISTIRGFKIKLEPSIEISKEPLERIAEEVLKESTNKLQLEITDAIVNWRIVQPGERLSAELPTKSIKMICNGYFLKTGDVKYFGVSSRNILFEREVLLEQTSPFELTSTRLSEIIEIPKEYISAITKYFPAISVEMYKRILSRTGVEPRLERPSIITFIPNDPKETQLEIFTYFLKNEMAKNDTCFILSSAEIESKFNTTVKSKSTIIPLLNYIGDLQREYAYILIPIVEQKSISQILSKAEPEKTDGSKKPEGEKADGIEKIDSIKKKDSAEKTDSGDEGQSDSQKTEGVIDPDDNDTKRIKTDSTDKTAEGEDSDKKVQEIEASQPTPESTEITYVDSILLSEIMFYIVTNGDQRALKIDKNIFCKIDTVILHRDSKMKVPNGKYYGQKHNVEFPIIDIPLSFIKTREAVNYAGSKHCKINHYNNNWIPYFPMNDMHRFIRTLKGRNVGLVLGGGGARGIAHIGIIEALEEAGIPIDAVGGTSMGAFVGALYAEGTNNKEVFMRAKRLTGLMGSIWRVLLDLTYPVCSMFTGKGFNWGLRLIFKNKRIEDLWLPYYCITTDISQFKEVKHTEGILWRYVRASMSLSGYLPPLCDKGSFLLDGGYMNNVPADAMRSMGIRNIIAVDVGSEVETNFADYGDSINGFYIMFQKIFSTKKFLSLTEIQYRLAYLTSMHKERSLKSDVSIKYIRPDLAGYKTMNFRQFDEIVAHGYQYGKKVITEWKKTGEYLELTTLTRASSKK